MPPWSSRLLSPSSRNESASPNPSTNATASSANARARLTESDILEHAYGIPSLPTHAQIQHGASASTKPSRVSSHGRSMSNPFPSLFTGKKKRNGESSALGGFESTDDDTISPIKQKVSDKDLKTGKCMTCDSMVRWPKELNVFRCTVCLTINDLKPITLEAKLEDGQRIPLKANASGSRFGPSISPRGNVEALICWFSTNICIVNLISVEKTRQIVDKCMTTYLLGRIKHEDGSSSSSENSAQQSPNLDSQTPGDVSLKPPPGPSDFLLPSPKRPMRPPGQPIGHASESSVSRQGIPFPNDYGNLSTAPYSTSSPGTFGAHMEQRNRDILVHQTRQQASRTSGENEEDPIERERINVAKTIFKPLEEYIITAFGSYECINTSFSTVRPNMIPRAASEGSKNIASPPLPSRQTRAEGQLSEMDAKTLLIGDFAENGFWWTGERSDGKSPERSRTHRGEVARDNTDNVTLKSPRIDWAELNEWYHIVISSGRAWRKKLDDFALMEYHALQSRPTDQELEEIDDQFTEAQFRIQRVLLKATESLLKRPSRPLNEPSDIRFLLIILANPLLYPSQPMSRSRERSRSRSKSREIKLPLRSTSIEASKRGNIPSSLYSPANVIKGSSGQHSGIIKRILGLLSNVSNECHHHLVSWLARYSDSQFQKITDLIGSFVTYRLTRQHGKKREVELDPTAGLIPNMGGRGEGTSAALHAALGVSTQSQSTKKSDGKPQLVVYNDDWQIKAAARVMALVFAANNSGLVRRGDRGLLTASESGHSAGLAARERAQRHGQILATSDFYNTLLDYSDLIADFEAWESRRGKFAFCQYPFFLSIWAKIQIMEHDARRQMEVKAREAFFDSIMTRKNVNQYLVLKIRRDCLVEDSLKGVSEVVGTGGEEIKKGLRIEFKGEEGIDAGGLRKEWFLLLVRDVFNPEHGMWIRLLCYWSNLMLDRHVRLR